MELKQLFYFRTVADEGTISGAARKLNMSQPPLSSQMHLLEEELGCLLFERGPRKIRLTEAGRIFYERAVTMLELAQVTAQEMEDYQKGKAGAMRIGLVSSVGAVFLQRWLLPFHEEFPQIHYEIYEGNTYQMLEYLRNSLVELALVRTPFEGEGLKAVSLAREPMMAAGRKEFFRGMRLSKDRAIRLRELEGKPLIVYRRWEDFLTAEFRRAGMEPTYFCKNDDARTSLSWASGGLGIAIFPASAVEMPESRGMEVYRIEEEGLVSQICAVCRPQGCVSAAARAMMERFASGSERIKK